MKIERTYATRRRQTGMGLACVALVIAAACSAPAEKQAQQAATAGGEDLGDVKGAFDTDETTGVPAPKTKEELEAARQAYSPFAGKAYPRLALFGDTHLHTANSGDAFMAGNRLSPEEAYRFARGEEVVSSTGIPVKLSRPLDFVVVADHAEGLGLMFQLYDRNPVFMADPTAARWAKAMKGTAQEQATAANAVVLGHREHAGGDLGRDEAARGVRHFGFAHRPAFLRRLGLRDR